MSEILNHRSTSSLNPNNNHSLFALHTSILSGEKNIDEDEGLRIRDFEQLPMRPFLYGRAVNKKFSKWPLHLFASGAFALAASVLLYLNISHQDNFTIKGSARISIVQEHEGIRTIFNETLPLQAGDKANAEILVAEDSIAFMGIFTKEGKMLSSLDDVKKSILKLQKGQKGFFPFAVELIGESEGETMVIGICESSFFHSFFSNFFNSEFSDISNFVTMFKNHGFDPEKPAKMTKSCQFKNVLLRP